MTGSPTDISVIIPAYNEAGVIDLALGSTQKSSGVERIVVDGGSSDGTPGVAQTHSARVVYSPLGRARQMNAGAEAAEGKFLVFLHADTRPPGRF